MEKAFDSGQQVDYMLSLEKQPCVTEFIPAEKRRLKMYQEKMPTLFFSSLPDEKRKKEKVKTYGKYRVRETFAGEESLTGLLTQYVERTVALRY